MNRLFVLISVLLLSVMSASAQYRQAQAYEDMYDSEAVSAIKKHVRELSAAALEGRKAGSEGEKAAADYVRNKLIVLVATVNGALMCMTVSRNRSIFLAK